MEIKDLNSNDQAVLVALFHKMVLSDRVATPEEMDHLDSIVEAIGEETYNDLSERVDELWGEGPATKAFLLSVSSQEARELIYGTILEVAIEDGVDGPEGELLDWLQENWYIQVEFVEE